MNAALPPDEALEQSLGEIIGELSREWRKDLDRIGAESRAVIAELRLEIATLKSELRANADQQIARVSEALQNVKDGAPGKDGERGPQGEAGAQGERGEIGERGADGPTGKDADPEVIAAIVAKTVDIEVAALELPRGEKGDAGPQGQEGPMGPAGKDADPELISAAVSKQVELAIDRLELPRGERGEIGPRGEPGPAGKDADPELIVSMVEDVVAKRVAEIVPPRGEKGEPGPQGNPGEAGRDGASIISMVIDRDGRLQATLSDGATKDLGVIVGKDGAHGARGIDGKDGRDGFGFDDLSVEHDGERGVMLRFVQGEQKKEFPLTFPVVIDRGVYRVGETYQRGDGVTWGGSFWISQAETNGEKPGTGPGWRLAVKRGQDGKDGVMKTPVERKTVKIV